MRPSFCQSMIVLQYTMCNDKHLRDFPKCSTHQPDCILCIARGISSLRHFHCFEPRTRHNLVKALFAVIWRACARSKILRANLYENYQWKRWTLHLNSENFNNIYIFYKKLIDIVWRVSPIFQTFSFETYVAVS